MIQNNLNNVNEPLSQEIPKRSVKKMSKATDYREERGINGKDNEDE